HLEHANINPESYLWEPRQALFADSFPRSQWSIIIDNLLARRNIPGKPDFILCLSVAASLLQRNCDNYPLFDRFPLPFVQQELQQRVNSRNVDAPFFFQRKRLEAQAAERKEQLDAQERLEEEEVSKRREANRMERRRVYQKQLEEGRQELLRGMEERGKLLQLVEATQMSAAKILHKTAIEEAEEASETAAALAERERFDREEAIQRAEQDRANRLEAAVLKQNHSA
ncbi:MAG: hypothetical protein EZS28_052550, partial [Streblomastix strix]